uniref:Uncharacterized protein n=1 Tax=Rhizophora mucronata TaxID=61149 RepID=A0A2P2PQF5_RHIMU
MMTYEAAINYNFQYCMCLVECLYSVKMNRIFFTHFSGQQGSFSD